MFPVARSAYLSAGTNSVGTSPSLNLSFSNTVKPATGTLETLFSFTVSGVVAVPPSPSIGRGVGVGVGAGLLAKGLNLERKFVSSVSVPSVGTDGRLKYNQPKIAITKTTRDIIKSVKFLFDIKYLEFCTT